MIASKSDLDLKEFYIIDNTFKFLPSNDEGDVDLLFPEYSIDIDYTFQTDDELSFQVYTKLGINDVDSQLGYLLKAEGVGFFEFDSKMSVEDKIKFLKFSALPICINNLRGFLAILTAHAPLGRYLLPAIDINDLIAQKSAKMKEIATKKSSKKKQKTK